ncbi:MAG: BTAD domain-containing putative transcriptional regulator [Salinisphaeraceae bacterium]|nr:BTAD domain-containing putative transcriptional regulator [Salinisphaeraceae bacterium]
MEHNTLSSTLDITLLGDFNLSYGAETIGGLNADRPQSLLAYLLLHRQAPQSRRHLAFLLWPDSSESQARSNLRNLLHTLRRILPHVDTWLAADSLTLQWRPDTPFKLDVADFEAAIMAAKSAKSSSEKQQWLETAVSLYRGDLLPSNYDDWLISIREELYRTYLEALDQLVRLLEESGNFQTAIRYSQRILQQDPLNEAATVQLMRLHALSGDRAGIRRVYQACVAALQRELDVEPAPATQAAYQQLLRLEAVVPLESAIVTPAVESIPIWSPRPLPVPATPFIGREVELAEITQLLAEPHCRLLTIVGMGGMGKTRLALQTAVAHKAIFPDGVAYVSLASLHTPDLLVAAVADALQFTFSAAGDPQAQLTAFLSQKEILLVLDNFEHLLSSPAAEENGGENWLAELLQSATRVKFLVTSRQRLALQEEWLYEVGGLALPDLNNLTTLVENSAIALFQQSARRVSNHFTLTEADQCYVTRICHLVGGAPLGIELAASWTRLLSCAEIAHEIEQGLSFLTITARNVPERHRSIQAIFDHSWRLLSPLEQQVLPQLAIFRGSFTREAAEQVAGADLNTLLALADKSLLQRTAVGRFNLHELVRQYAATRLHEAVDDEQETKNRHAFYYLTLLQSHEQLLQSQNQKASVDTLMLDIDNIRAAWKVAVAQEQITLLRGVAYTFWYFYELRNYFIEGVNHLAQAAEKIQNRLAEISKSDQPDLHRNLSALLGELWAYLGFYNIHLGETKTSISLTTAAVNLLRPLEEPRAFINALCLHSLILRTKSSYDEVLQIANQGLPLSRALGQRWQEAIFMAMEGVVAHDRGDYAQAYARLKEAMDVSRALGDPRHIAYIGNNLSRTARIAGRTAEVEALLSEALQMTRENDDRLGMGMALEQLAQMAQESGNCKRAYRLYQESVTMYQESGDAFHLSQALNLLGHFYLATGESEKARETFIQTCQIADSMRVYIHALNACLGLAIMHMTAGESEQALEIVEHILQHPVSNCEAQERAERLRVELAANLSPAQIAWIDLRVRERPFDQFITDLLQTDRRFSDPQPLAALAV